MNRRNCISRWIAVTALLAATGPAWAQSVLIRMGSPAPEGSVWHDVLLQMRQDWTKISGDKVTLKIYPGAVPGTEVQMLRKVRLGELQAVALSGVGLLHAEPGVSCFQIPLLIESYEELDYVRDRIAPRLEQQLLQKGLVVLNWSDAGWVYFFTTKPARTLADIRGMKLFTSAGDPQTEKLYKDFGFQPVPLALNDIHMALKTRMIEAFDVPSLMALLEQTFALAGHMIDVKWAPLVAATLVDQRVWDRIPEAMRPELLRAARRAAELERSKIRRLGDEAVVEMQKRGLKVIRPTGAELAGWRAEAEAAYPKLRGTYVPADLFDETKRLVGEFRASRPGKGSQ